MRASHPRATRMKILSTLLCLLFGSLLLRAQITTPQSSHPVSEADRLRGEYGPYRANNDLLYYHLDVRVDPDNQLLSGKNTIRFSMLEPGTRIQLDLVPVFNIDKILLDEPSGSTRPLKYERAAGRTVYVDFPRPEKGRRRTPSSSTTPAIPSRWAALAASCSAKTHGPPLVNTACEEEGASVWWPNKDQWRDEPETMDISVEAPSNLVEVSNGRLQRRPISATATRAGTGTSATPSTTTMSRSTSATMCISTTPTPTNTALTLDYFVFPKTSTKRSTSSSRSRTCSRPMSTTSAIPLLPRWLQAGRSDVLRCRKPNRHHLRQPLRERLSRPPKTGIGTWFDFIIVHESAHEWFGNSITARDRSDMWIHEGWANYCESLFVEYMWGKGDAITYVNTGKENVKNAEPIICQEGTVCTPPVDQYKKGGLFLNTLRSVIDDDREWFALLHDYYQHFKYQTIMTTDMVAFFNQHTKRNLTPIFNEYLRHAAIPVLELKFDPQAHTVTYRWQADEPAFAMPIKVGDKDHWQIITPVTTRWQTLKTPLDSDHFDVATDLYYVNVRKS